MEGGAIAGMRVLNVLDLIIGPGKSVVICFFFVLSVILEDFIPTLPTLVTL